MSANFNGVIFQGFHWFLYKDDSYHGSKPLWEFLKEEAYHLRQIGIDAVWIPPAYKGNSGENDSVGYDVHDHFDLGEFVQKGSQRTKYGTKEQLLAAIQELHNNNIQVYADIVLNHKSGGDVEDYFWQAIRVDKDNRNHERWGNCYECGLIEVKGYTKFTHAPRDNKYSSFKWNVRHFDSIDTAQEISQNGNIFTDQPSGRFIYRLLYNELGYNPPDKRFETWVSLEKGNYDYLIDTDLDYGRVDVREEMKFWGEWFVKELGLDGVRLDAVKHISADYIREWLGHVRAKTGKQLFAVGEYIDSGTNPLHGYITRVTVEGEYPQDICLLDFPLRFLLRNASWEGQSFDLRNLNWNTLMVEQPAKAVTFVENHDYQNGRSLASHVEEWIKPLGYAFILLRDRGYPCIFFPDYYGSQDKDNHRGQPSGREYIDLLLQLRKQFALGEERYYEDRNVVGWVRMGGIVGAKGAMAVVMSNSFRTVSTIRMNTGRFNRRLYHFATMKYNGRSFEVVRYRYDLYGDKAEGLWTDSNGWADFLAEGGTVSIWIEDGVGLN